MPGTAPTRLLVPYCPCCCGQGVGGIHLITHILYLPTHPHGQRLDYTVRFSPLPEMAFCFYQRWSYFRSKDMRGCGVNRLTGCLRSQHCKGHVLQRRSVKAVPTACRTALLLHSCARKLWSSPLRHESEKDPQSKSPSEIPVLICISWMLLPVEKLYITVEARLFAAKLSICAAIRHSLPPDLCHTV